MPRTRINERGQLEEIPPTTLDCGHPYRGNVTVGITGLPGGGRVRSYRCRTCGELTLDP